MFGNPTVNLRRGWSGGHSQYAARISSILSLFGGIAEYPPPYQRLQNRENRAVYWECPPDHPLLRLTVGFPNNTILIYLYFFIY